MLNSLFFSAMLLLTFNEARAYTCTSLNKNPYFNELLTELKNQNINCEGIKTHFSFDDGPNEKTSGIILNELDKRNIKATFFATTTNLAPGSPGLAEKKSILQRQLQNGHTVASHGHEHNAYDMRITGEKESGYTFSQREQQISTSEKLLDSATNGKFTTQELKLFRFPYGRGAMPSQKEIEEMEKSKKMIFQGSTYAEKLKEYRRMSSPLQQIGGHGFSHVGWNHDSNDSSLPYKMPSEEVFKEYVKNNVKNICSPSVKTKVSLFHDTKEVNTKAIPLIADLGNCLGLTFMTPKEMMANKTLENSEVIIKSKTISAAPATLVKDIGNLIKMTTTPARQCPDVDRPQLETNIGGCYSTYSKKMFKNCEGETSKCYEGKWYVSQDPFILLNCAL